MKHEFGGRDYAHNFKDFNGNQSLDFFSPIDNEDHEHLKIFKTRE